MQLNDAMDDLLSLRYYNDKFLLWGGTKGLPWVLHLMFAHYKVKMFVAKDD